MRKRRVRGAWAVLAGLLGTGSAVALARGGPAPVTTTLEFDAASLLDGSRALVASVGSGASARVVVETGAALGHLGTLPRAVARLDRIVASLNAETPKGSSVQVSVRVRKPLEAEETAWLSLGRVGSPDDAEGVPASEAGPKAKAVRVAIDTVELDRPIAGEVELQLVLRSSPSGESPRVRRVVVVAWAHGSRDAERTLAEGQRHPSWGRVLDVPERSQRVEDPSISGRICSATSLGMVLAFHGKVLETKDVCREVLDRRAQIYGNWALNVAFAGRLGLEAHVGRCGSFAPLEDEIAAGRPVVLTHRWSKGELAGAPIDSTDGHLIVLRGFTKEGDLVVNDPAARPGSIRRVYKRSEIAKTWLENADGVVYLVRP